MAKTVYTNNKDLNDLVNRVIASGTWEAVERGKHNKIRHKASGRTVVFSITPACPRAPKNAMRDIRHVEAGLPGFGMSKEITTNICLKQSKR